MHPLIKYLKKNCDDVYDYDMLGSKKINEEFYVWCANWNEYERIFIIFTYINKKWFQKVVYHYNKKPTNSSKPSFNRNN